MANDVANIRRRESIQRIEAAISGIFHDIQCIAKEFERIWATHASYGKVPTSIDLKPLRGLADDILTKDNISKLGMGVVLEPGVLGGCDMFCEWRHIGGDGRPAQLDLNFNRSSESYYNYRDKPWFTQPREDGKSVVEGPFIDLYGQDAYILTFTQALFSRDSFIGIAGADVDLGRFERILVPSLLHLNHEALLINETGRVLATNNARWLPGERFLAPKTGSDAEQHITQLARNTASWRLVEYF